MTRNASRGRLVTAVTRLGIRYSELFGLHPWSMADQPCRRQLPPLADKWRWQTVSNAPHFADWVEWCLQARKNIGENVWNTTKKCIKFACNYFKNSSTSGGLRSPDSLLGLRPWTPGLASPRPPVVLPHPKPPSAAYATMPIRPWILR